MDSRFDPRYENTNIQDDQYDNTNNQNQPRGGNTSGLPIPSFAPLPSYAGAGGAGGSTADDLSSVGGDSAYDSQYGSTRSFFTAKSNTNNVSTLSKDARAPGGPSLGYYVGGPSSNYFGNAGAAGGGGNGGGTGNR